ncbi:hypothetical protein BH11PSE13_BH11PSE13_37970 [soil metagenome]
MLSATTIATLILLTLAARELYLALWLNRSICIQAQRKGWLAIELRRRVAMERVPGHVSAYPVPREERILVSRLLGLVLWHREVSVALPNGACEHLAQVMPQDFDGEFPSWLRLMSPRAEVQTSFG